MTGDILSIRTILFILSKKTLLRQNTVFSSNPLSRKCLILKGSFSSTLPKKDRANVPFSAGKCLILLGPISR